MAGLTSAMLVAMAVAISYVHAEEAGTNFFLKASKSVPRIGRRGDADFLKASKSVPRIGRRRDNDFNLEPFSDKRYFAEKDYGESGLGWLSTDTSMMQGDEPYRDGEEYQYQYQYRDPYYQAVPHKRSVANS